MLTNNYISDQSQIRAISCITICLRNFYILYHLHFICTDLNTVIQENVHNLKYYLTSETDIHYPGGGGTLFVVILKCHQKCNFYFLTSK